MLHILLLILKIIGIIFAVILGILVLLVCIVVFVPVRYEVTAKCPGALAELKGKGKVTWLFHLVRADVYYKENRLKWRVRIGWKKFLGGADYGQDGTPERHRKKGAQSKRTRAENADPGYISLKDLDLGEIDFGDDGIEDIDLGYIGMDDTDLLDLGTGDIDLGYVGIEEDDLADTGRYIDLSYICTDDLEIESVKAHIKEEKKDEEKNDAAEKDAEDEKGKKSASEALEESGETKESSQKIPEGSEEEKRRKARQNKAYRSKAWETDEEIPWSRNEESGDESDHEDKGLYEKIKDIFYRIKCTIRNICGKIKELLEKKDRLLKFLRDESHVSAYKKLKKEAVKLIRRLKPARLEAEVIFGFDDPSVTGRLLAFLAVLYPSYGRWVSLHPDFEKKILKGRLYGKGRIRFLHFAVFVWNLLWSRHVRSTYRDIRNFEFNAEGD